MLRSGATSLSLGGFLAPHVGHPGTLCAMLTLSAGVTVAVFEGRLALCPELQHRVAIH